MLHYLGSEGMGYFNAAYTIYTWLYMLSTAGVPVAISILVSKALAQGDIEKAESQRKTATRFLCLVGILGTAFVLIFAPKIAYFVGSPSSVYAIIAIAPTLLFVCVSSVQRGYFQGRTWMHPTAWSQIFEGAGKLVPGILLAVWAMKSGKSLPEVAGYTVLGVTFGAFFSMVYLLLIRRKYQRRGLILPARQVKDISWRENIQSLFKIALPITISATVMSVTNLIDLGMIMRQLQRIGYSATQASALYGNYTTLVVPLFNLPSVFVYPIAYAIVPVISDAIAKHKHEEARGVGESALRYSTMIAMPFALGIGAFSYPILSAIFPSSSAEIAAPYLTVISPGIVFICILAVTNSILQAYGEQNKPIISMLFGGMVKIIFGYFMIGSPKIGMMGAPLGTLFCYITVAFINFYFIRKKTGISPGTMNFLLKPLFSAGVSVLVALALYRNLISWANPLLLLACSALLAVLPYVVLVFKLSLFSEEELTKIPKIRQIWIKIKGRKHKKRSLLGLK